MKSFLLFLPFLIATVYFLLIPSVQTTPDAESPRGIYNEGVLKLNAGLIDDAQPLFLQARDKAGPDSQLRIAAAYNLGLTLAKKARNLEELATKPKDVVVDDMSAEESDQPKSEDSLRLAAEAYSQAASWFQDVIRLDETDDSARQNLEVVLKRLQLVNDKLNQGDNSLESRLNRLLSDTRTLLDEARVLSGNIANDGDGADPTSRRQEFNSLAVQARTLQAAASNTLQSSNEEIEMLNAKQEAAQSDEEKIRLAQLTALNRHLTNGRDEIASSRRRFRKLDVNSGMQALIDAVQALVRAQEQLADPLTVLKTVAGEEQRLFQQSSALAALQAQSMDSSSVQKIPQLPPWFDGPFLGKTQAGLHARANEVLMRFKLLADSVAQSANDSKAQEPDEMTQLTIEAISPLMDAVEAMKSAEGELGADRIALALNHERDALENLMLAIERFSDARTLIELSHQTQLELVTLTSDEPPSSNSKQEAEDDNPEPLKQGLIQNIGRLKRLKSALNREKEKQLSTAQQAQSASTAENDPISQVDALFEQAESHRLDALKALEAMQLQMTVSQEPESDAPPEDDAVTSQHDKAQSALKSIKELRILFFSIIEHIQDLLEKQTQTRDQTVAASAEDYDKMLQSLLTITPEQQGHTQRAQALKDALEEQADAAYDAIEQSQAAVSQSQPDQADPARQRAEALSQAALELGLAYGFMSDAEATMTKVQTEEGGMSHEVGPAADDQELAIEALKRALEALQPPQNEPNEDQQDQDDQVEKKEAERRLQEAKEREAQRQKDKGQKSVQAQSVERDW